MSTRSVLLSGLLAVFIGASGCSSSPPPAVAAEAAQEQKQVDVAMIDKKVAEAATRLSKIERDGVVYYCKRSRPMGSNITRLNCMTEAQLRTEVETTVQNRDDMRNKMGKCTAGRAGHGGPCGGW